jgi:hypothetical protein
LLTGEISVPEQIVGKSIFDEIWFKSQKQNRFQVNFGLLWETHVHQITPNVANTQNSYLKDLV